MIFAPIAVLVTYTNWREQRRTGVIAEQCKLTLSKVIRSQEEYNCLHNSFMQENRDYGISKKYLENFHIARLEVKQEFSLLKEMVGGN